MPTISLEHLQPGMRLADDITEQSGRILLRAGSELNARQLTVLKAWGITEADVVDVSSEQVVERARASLDPESLREAEAEARVLFARTDLKHPAMRELYRLFVLRKVKERASRGFQNAR